MEYFIEAGIDCLNPIQTSTARMDPVELKQRFGGRIVLWGGGPETQTVLPHGSADDVRERTKERIRIFEPAGCTVVCDPARKDAAYLAGVVRDVDAVITGFAPVNADVIGAMQKARVIVRYGIGVDNVDLKAAAAKNIPVCNIPDYCIDEVADHTLALILAATRQLVPCVNTIKAGQWKLPAWVTLETVHALKDMTVGLVAFGRIGREVAARLKPFKSRILVFDPVVPAAAVRDAGCEPATLDEVFAKSDLLSLHCPSTEKTRYMINAESLAKMKKGAILVNASRGTLVQTPDLIAALQSGKISAVASDVSDPEPINPDNPLLKMDTPGESICLEPGVYHAFWGQKGKGPVVVGEVSAVNEDMGDNRFAERVARFPTIEEDERPLHLLCNEYPPVGTRTRSRTRNQ